MTNWRGVPFIRIIIPFIAGILLAFIQPIALLSDFYWLPICFLFLVVQQFIRLPFQYRWLSGVLINLALLLVGYQLADRHDGRKSQDHYSRLATETSYLVGTINQSPTPKNRIQLSLDVTAVGADAQSLSPCSGQLMVYLSPDSSARRLRYGDQLILQTSIRAVEGPKNPKAFDYQHYLSLRNIHYHTSPDSNQWRLLAREQGHPVLATALRLRQRALHSLHRHLGYGNEYAIVAALVLGDKRHLSEEVRNAYSDTGAMHVLAVSGLHVGLIFLGLNWLLGWVRLRSKSWKLIKTLLLLLGIWAFAVLTGASASVLRATSMFSFVILGLALQRNSSIYNTLAASAFCLLCFNPYLLFEAGFQLSYLAVVGIVFFQPKLYGLWYIENKVGDYLWKLVAVGLAAQLTTFPLTIYYFHQFPLYFWLSGLIVVPAAMLILSAGIAVLLLELVLPFLAMLVGKLLFGITWLSNSLIFLLLQLPGGLVGGLWIEGLSLALLFLIVASSMVAIEGKRMKYLLVAVGLLVVLSAQLVRSNIQHMEQQSLTVYSIHRHSQLDYFDGQQGLSLGSAGLAADKARFAVENHRMASGIKHLEQYTLGQDTLKGKRYSLHGPYLQFNNTRLAIIDQPLSHAVRKKRLQLDYLLLRNNPRVSVEQLNSDYDIGTLIIDASNSRRRRATWQKESAQLGISTYDLVQNGAIIIDLK